MNGFDFHSARNDQQSVFARLALIGVTLNTLGKRGVIQIGKTAQLLKNELRASQNLRERIRFIWLPEVCRWHP